jgi:hypothetical protein
MIHKGQSGAQDTENLKIVLINTRNQPETHFQILSNFPANSKLYQIMKSFFDHLLPMAFGNHCQLSQIGTSAKIWGLKKIGFQVGHKGLKIGGNENVFINTFF